MRANVVPIRVPKQPAEPPTAKNQIGASGTEALYLEVPIRTMGFRVTTGPGGEILKGESFEEETTTMLLFARGAVIRLSAAVAPGQDLLLVNKRTNKYVHCRIKNVRAIPEVKSYVEIEFTHTAPEFWGISFPKEALRTAAASFAPSMPARLPEESWRAPEQEFAAKAFAAAAGAATQTATPAVPSPAPAVAVDFGPMAPSPIAEWDDTVPPRPYFPPHVETPTDAGHSTMERVHAAPRVVQYINLESLIVPEERSNKVRVAWVAAGALCALLLGYRLFASDEPEVPAVVVAESPTTGDTAQPAPAANPSAYPAGRQQGFAGPSEKPGTKSNSSGENESANTVTAEMPELTTVDSPRRLVVLVSKMNLPVQKIVLTPKSEPELNLTGEGGPNVAPAQPSAEVPGGSLGLLTKASPEPPPPAPEPAPTPAGAEQSATTMIPARLVTSVQPNYPLLAKTAHIEGDVVVEVQIDTLGNVAGTKVLSGPQVLRGAATAALEKWKFEPARLREKTIASTTIVTVRFRPR